MTGTARNWETTTVLAAEYHAVKAWYGHHKPPPVTKTSSVLRRRHGPTPATSTRRHGDTQAMTDRCKNCGYKGPHEQDEDDRGTFERCGNCGTRTDGLGKFESMFMLSSDADRSDVYFEEGDRISYNPKDITATVKSVRDDGLRVRANGEDADALLPYDVVLSGDVSLAEA